MAAYYNEVEPAAAHVIECLIKEGVIADGVVDRRSISDVDAVDVKEFTQCHFFAGGGLWSVALRLAGWSDARSVWTGSCPCQPFSAAGKGAGKNDKRHLWPDFFRLIRACRPSVVMGEQVAGTAGYDWFDGVASDLEGIGHAARAVDIPALAVGASHIRQRLYWVGVGNTVSTGLEGFSRNVPGRNKSGRIGTVAGGSIAASGDRRDVADANSIGCDGIRISECAGIESTCGSEPVGHGEDGRIHGQDNLADADDAIRWENVSGRDDANRDDARREETTSYYGSGGPWDGWEWHIGADGKARRVKSGVRLLSDGIPGRIHLLRLGGNAIVPPLAAEVIKAMMESDDIFFC